MIPRAELEDYLNRDYSSQEIADWTGMTYDQVLTQIRSQIGRGEASVMRKNGRRRKIIAAWEKGFPLHWSYYRD